jgi:hypothetical protein
VYDPDAPSSGPDFPSGAPPAVEGSSWKDDVAHSSHGNGEPPPPPTSRDQPEQYGLPPHYDPPPQHAGSPQHYGPPPQYAGAPPRYPAQPMYPPPAYAPAAYAPQQTRTNGFSIASMVLGILWIYWIGSILALIFGYIAKGQIERSGGLQTGRGMSIAGIVLGWIGVGVLLLALVLGIGIGLAG